MNKNMANKVIFLDIDGVLNCRITNDRLHGALGIDPDKLNRLKQIVEVTGATIVLISSWKDYWEREYKEQQDDFANYLDLRLKSENLQIYDKTEDKYWNRGEGILNWIKVHDVMSFIIVDDERFDYDNFEVLSKRLIETTEGADNGGLQDTHVKRAISLLK